MKEEHFGFKDNAQKYLVSFGFQTINQKIFLKPWKNQQTLFFFSRFFEYQNFKSNSSVPPFATLSKFQSKLNKFNNFFF